MTGATIRTRGIVLKRTNYGEADRIIHFLTPLGRQNVMAKGVRREKSRLAGGVELFAVSDIVVTRGHGDLGILTSARLVTFYRSILSEYDRVQFGYEAIKQVNRAVETVEEPAFYELLEGVLAALNDTSIDLRLTEAWFWLQLAILQGVGLNLATDIEGHKLREEARYEFDATEFGFREHPNGTYTASHIKILRLLSVKPPHIATHVGGIEAQLDDCVWLARQAMAH